VDEVESPPWQKPKLPELGLTVTDSTSGAACSDNCVEAVAASLAAVASPTVIAPPTSVSVAAVTTMPLSLRRDADRVLGALIFPRSGYGAAVHETVVLNIGDWSLLDEGPVIPTNSVLTWPGVLTQPVPPLSNDVSQAGVLVRSGPLSPPPVLPVPSSY
jgi:hypothetical protein